MATINYIIGGQMGDFIHNLFACKNICELHGAKANLFLGGGDPFAFGTERAYHDLKEIVLEQPYVNSFEVFNNQTKNFVNLNDWRKEVINTRATTGKYDVCWSELMAKTYGFDLPSKEYQYLFSNSGNTFTEGKVVIHRSLNRNNDDAQVWDNFFKHATEPPIFITSNIKEFTNFKYRNKSKLLQVGTITSMVRAISSCSLFIGNQSAPFAIANGLDVPRICELDYDAGDFYIGEEKYSDKISWVLNDKIKYYHESVLL